MGRVAGKIVIVTGAANGLGRAMADALAREGAGGVVLTDIDVAAGEQAAAALREAGHDARFIRHDVCSEAEWAAVLEATIAAHGRVDVLVNNAGGGTYSDIESCTLAEFRKVVAVNLDGTFLGTQAAVKAMKETGGGAIVNISSVAAMVGSPNLVAYCAAKAGIQALSRSAAVYCGERRYGIRINSIHPGLIDTRSGREMARLATGQDDETAIGIFAGLHPIGRIGVPEDVAQAVLYLASDDSAFVTGASLVVDGGMTARP